MRTKGIIKKINHLIIKQNQRIQSEKRKKRNTFEVLTALNTGGETPTNGFENETPPLKKIKSRRRNQNIKHLSKCFKNYQQHLHMLNQVIHLKIYLMKLFKLFVNCVEQKKSIIKYTTV